MTELPPWPTAPFDLVPAPGFAPAARRRLGFCGAEVELCWMPERKHRSGRPSDDRPPFLRSPAERIIAEEEVLRRGSIAVTPNRFPFAERHLLLWQTRPMREADPELLEAVLSLADQVDGTAIVNSIGAAASIPRAHAHVLGDRTGFLPGFPRRPLAQTFGIEPGLARIDRIDGLPIECLVVEGPLLDRVRVAHELLLTRMTTAFNLIGESGCVFLVPRSAIEIPAPHFPQALGASEIWGRWCFHDRDAFDGANEQSLRQALETGGHRPGAAG